MPFFSKLSRKVAFSSFLLRGNMRIGSPGGPLCSIMFRWTQPQRDKCWLHPDDPDNKQLAPMQMCIGFAVPFMAQWYLGCYMVQAHRTLRLWIPCPFQGGEETGVPYLVVERGMSRVLHRNNLIKLHSATFAACVSRLLLIGSCKLSFPFMVPPTVAFPHLGCVTNVPRLIPNERVPP